MNECCYLLFSLKKKKTAQSHEIKMTDFAFQNISLEEIGGISYFLKYKDIYLPYIILYLLGFIVGCVGLYHIIINFKLFFHFKKL